MGVYLYVAFSFAVNFLLVGNAHQMESRKRRRETERQRERGERVIEETSTVTREREQEISVKKRAMETGNEEEERCMSPERLVYSC